MKHERVKKPFYKKWWVWLLAVILVSGIIGGEEDVPETASEPASQSVEAEPDASEPEGEAEEAVVEEETEEVVVEEEVEETPEESTMTLAQENAVKKAESYLDFSAFSKSGLVEQLEFEGFSNEEATFAVDHIEVDWNEQAANKAQDYLDFTAFSRTGLIEQLEFDGFTPAEATYGVDQAGL